MEQLTEKDFYFCFSKKLSLFLKGESIPYITKAKSVKDDAIYTIYHKTDALDKALEKYNENI